MIAGPNGSGKTTLTRWLSASGLDLGEYINADDIALGLSGDPQSVSLEAQRLADAARRDCLDRRVSFSFETVMSHPSKVEFLLEAKALGYYVMLFFVGTEDPRVNVARVEMRVAMGGHSVPMDRILLRYDRTMNLLPDAILASNRTVLFDNSRRHLDGGADFRSLIEIEQVEISGQSSFEFRLAGVGTRKPIRLVDNLRPTLWASLAELPAWAQRGLEEATGRVGGG